MFLRLRKCFYFLQNGVSPTVGPVGNNSPITMILLQVALALSLTAEGLAFPLNPEPRVDSISPPTILAGSARTKITLRGSDFVLQSQAKIGTEVLPTTFVSSTQLVASIPAELFVRPGTLQFTVFTPPPGGGTSVPVILTVLEAGQVSPTTNPQVAKYSFTSPRNAKVSVEFGPDTSYGSRTWAQSTPPGGGTVDILVAGMRSFTTYHMRAEVKFPGDMRHVDVDHTFTTGGLPPDRLPNLTVTRPSSLTPNPGVELLHLSGPDKKLLEVAVADLDGNIIWFYDYNPSALGDPFPFKLLPNGDILLNFNSPGPIGTGTSGIVREIDLAGNIIRQFTTDDVNSRLASAGFNLVVSAIHHDFAFLPNGHLILLVNHYKDFADLPGYPGTLAVLGDAIVDLDENLSPVWVWDTFDHLDINRHPVAFPDWTHGNALVYSPDDGSLLLSMRHQHWIIKIDYQDGRGSGDVLWRLGYQGDFALQNGGPADWFYGQHFPNFAGPGSANVFKLAVFDNGVNRVLDPKGTICGAQALPCYSRATIFNIQEPTRTAELLWQDKLSVFSFFIGSIGLMDNHDVEFDVGVTSLYPPAARVLEVTQETTPEVVWQLDINGQFSYRAFRIPSLYPGVQW